jgi:nitroreductase/NAD-dependent dihydropyrimidine dehydrogenase PreA subunit
MSALTVDREKCDACGICVLECPATIIQLAEPGPFPAWVEGGDEFCIVCGHCVAACPLGAIGLDGMKPEDCTMVRRDTLPTAEQVELLIRSRRSIRAYKEERVPREVLENLIDVARYAPSGSNAQPVHWLVVEDPDEVKRLGSLIVDWMRSMLQGLPATPDTYRFDLIGQAWDAGIDIVMRGAPHLIVAHAPAEDVMAATSGTIALTTLELAAYSHGLGTCWAGFFHMAAMLHRPMMETLRLPEGHAVLGGMMIGYPKYKFARIPLRNEARVIWR